MPFSNVQNSPVQRFDPLATSATAVAEQPPDDNFAVPQLSPVERFRQINEGLPDGVQYEPLDTETLLALREASQAMPAAMDFNSPSAPNDLISQLAQDERNAYVFYTSLAESAPKQAMRNTIKGIADAAAERSRVWGEVYRNWYGYSFTPNETEINTSVSFADGVALAMQEENKAIQTLADWLDELEDAQTARVVQNMINKKMVNYNFFSQINSEL